MISLGSVVICSALFEMIFSLCRKGNFVIQFFTVVKSPYYISKIYFNTTFLILLKHLPNRFYHVCTTRPSLLMHVLFNFYLHASGLCG